MTGQADRDEMNSPPALCVGRTTLDVVYSLNHFPSEDTKIFAHAIHVAPGGPATNAAITYARLGGKAQLMTTIGGGPWATTVRNELGRLGIEIIDLAEGTSYETPLTTVLVNVAQATRTIVNPPRSEVQLSRPKLWEQRWGESPALVLTDGFHLAETLPLLRTLQMKGTQICLDGGSWKPATDELAGLLSIAICSERFIVPQSPAHPDATIDWFVEKGVPHVAITRGASPIIGWDRGRKFAIEIEKIHAVDTTGAGDVLHGAFCFHFARNGNFEQALRIAAEIATRSCRQLGIEGCRGTD
jgi:sugar/nucleoside kinase (ribokinase family)